MPESGLASGHEIHYQEKPTGDGTGPGLVSTREIVYEPEKKSWRLTRGWRMPLAFILVGVGLVLSLLMAFHATSLNLGSISTDETLSTNMMDMALEITTGEIEVAEGDVVDGTLVSYLDDGATVTVFDYSSPDSFCLIGTIEDGKFYNGSSVATYDEDARGMDRVGGACDLDELTAAGYTLGYQDLLDHRRG